MTKTIKKIKMSFKNQNWTDFTYFKIQKWTKCIQLKVRYI